jgi:hypothetical protein
MKNNIVTMLVVIVFVVAGFLGYNILRDDPIVSPVIPTPAPQQVIIQQVEQIVR